MHEGSSLQSHLNADPGVQTPERLGAFLLFLLSMNSHDGICKFCDLPFFTFPIVLDVRFVGELEFEYACILHAVTY